MKKITAFFRKEPTFCIALLAAAVSCVLVPPDREYLGYIDLRTLALLYSLMVVVAGLRTAGVFDRLSHVLCSRAKTVRGIGLLLVLLCFFSAMLVTNDVALLTFVPFAAAVLTLAKAEKQLIWVVVLQTVAANLGSMLTPVGNPQNLYLYSRFSFSFAQFLQITGPIWVLSLVMVCVLCLRIPGNRTSLSLGAMPALSQKPLLLYSTLFLVCLLVVLRVLDWPVMLGILVAALVLLDRRRLLEADFLLLATFVWFFIFSGNLARVESVNRLLRSALLGRELAVGAAVSQVISNVPAALLLSGFTEAGRELLLGVNIGGLGTPIASLASLISLKLYAQTPSAQTGKYLRVFLILNFALLLLLLLAAKVL